MTVPEPRPLPDGSPFAVVDGRRCVLLSHLEGESLLVLDPADAALRVGRTLGRLHAHSATWRPPAGLVFPVHAVETPSAAALGLSPDACELLETAARLVRRAMDRVGRAPAVFGLVHGDASFQNFVLSEGEACPIDFDESGIGHHLSDVAEPIRVVEHRRDHGELRRALLEGYRSARWLDPGHEAELDAFVIGNYLSVLAWASRPEAAARRGEILPWLPAWLDSIRRLAVPLE